jgi:suppressor of G2 allele of SKP1
MSNNTAATISTANEKEQQPIVMNLEQDLMNGDTAYIMEEYDTALQHYTTALQNSDEWIQNHCNTTTATTKEDTIQEHGAEQLPPPPPPPQLHRNTNTVCQLHFRLLLRRSAVYLQLLQYENAWLDTKQAIDETSSNTNVKPNSQDAPIWKSNEVEFCYRQHGIASFALREYYIAMDAFQMAVQFCNQQHRQYNPQYYQDFIQKCRAQFQQPNEIVPTVDTPHDGSAQSPPSLSPATAAAAAAAAAISPPASVSSSSFHEKPIPRNQVDIAAMTPKYQYYQNDKIMTIVLLESNVQPLDLHVQYETNQQIHVQLKKNGYEYHVIHGDLYDAIVVDKCKVVIRADKVLIKLCKENINYEWNTLLSDQKKNKKTTTTSTRADASTTATTTTTTATINTTNTTTSASPTKENTSLPKPYASSSSHRNWDQIEKDIDLELQQEKPEGDEAMNQLFRQIYANANADTRRAMIKSFQTSGGTCLSTNWEEVATKDYERDRIAPDGQEWKTYDGKKL